MTAIIYLTLFVIISAIFSCCEAGLPRNIEVVYPFPLPPPYPSGNPPATPLPDPSTALQPPPDLPTPSSKSSKKAVGTAIGVTAATTLVLSVIFFFLLPRYCRRKKKETVIPQATSHVAVLNPNEFARFNGNLKGVIVDESGSDVLYWRKLENQDAKESFKKQIIKYVKNEPKEVDKQVISSKTNGDRESGLQIQEVPFLQGEASSSQNPNEEKRYIKAIGNSTSTTPSGNNAQLPTPSKTPSALPPPIPMKGKSPAILPPPPPIHSKKDPAPPPPPPSLKAGSLALSSAPAPAPPAPAGQQHGREQESHSEGGSAQVKLKPLHWDKVNANTNHSMVWNKIEGGSFRVDDDLMEALFGYIATNKKSPKSESSPKLKGNKYSPPAQVFILDTRKSQNIAIVLRTLAISRKEIIYALTEGQGLHPDVLEKLNRITPTKEEEADILAFDGDYTKLADAESFIYHLLKAVPSAFMRFNAMLFRSNYDSEISQFRESLQVLESACKELRTQGIFLKLLEAVLKAGNRMNAGTSRGNAQAFNLTALRKLSDVKSKDGKTTLLHFVVEEVVRAEGKRNVLNRNNSLSASRKGNKKLDISLSRDEKEKEYLQLGLPVVGGLSSEFSNVKKSATMDYDSIAKTCSILATRAAEIGNLVAQCGDDGGGFARVMKNFLDEAEQELRAMREEQTRVLELVRKTTEYYHAGASKEKDANTLQLFVIIKDFLGMVDQACVEIARNSQRKKSASSVGSSPESQSNRAMRFPILPANFLAEYPSSSSSDSDDDSHVKPHK